ncbi:MAG: efflux RND transporter periplasmic adaptor subunit [Firmicutes bacterium]|nr:efflux RND transporter periplasmic adaptor subunit [Bacillota bacterium]
MKKLPVYILILAFLGFFGYRVVTKIATRNEPPANYARFRGGSTITAVRVLKVEEAPLVESINVVGEITTDYEINIQPQVSGRLLQLPVKKGDEVRAGQLLAVIDDETINLQIQQAENNIAIIKANMKEAELRLARAEAEEKRYKELLEHRYISESEYENVKNAYLTALTALEIITQQLASAEKNLELLQIQLGQTKIHSPIDGFILETKVTPGMNLTTGTVILSMAPLSPVQLVFNVDQRDAARIKKGSPVEFQTDALPGQVFTSQTNQSSPVYDPQTRSLTFSATFPNQPVRLEPGMFGTVKVIVGQKERALTVPQEALVTLERQNGVFVVVEENEETIAKFQPVATGGIVGNLIEITSGLSPGDQVIIIGQERLRPGEKVEIIGDDAR